ncbi:hypothetical protein [Stenotrophomonas sp. SMYL20]|uniref:fimbrial protein n=1 Tax=Stenotrophomonas sp. SMYL20 TaxID=3076043 RepID=UPI002E78DC0B|nr:hypothetical protein [Stenotrophomonas sp. SMYL20]
MPSAAPSIADSLRRLHSGAGPMPSGAGELQALRQYPRRLMLACGAVLSLLSLSVLITLIVVQVNGYEARRIAEFRRAHTALQFQLARQDASHARLANMAEYAWDRDVQLGDASAEAMRRDYLQGGQRLVVAADASSRPQMALGLETAQWRPQELQRYLQLTTAVSLIQRLTRTADEGEPDTASYFFDPSGQYLSLDKGLTERSLISALAASSRSEVFEHLRAPAQLLAPASSHDQVPLLESVERSDGPRRTFGRHPISGEPSLVSVFQASLGATPIATFVAYEPMARLQALLRHNSQGHIALLDRDGLRVLTSDGIDTRAALAGADTDWVLLGDATRARFHKGRFTLALAVAGTPWTLVETYRWADILRGVAPMLLSDVACLLVALALLWFLLLWLHRRMYTPAFRQVKAIYARDRRLRLLLEHVPVGVALLEASTGHVQDWNGPLQRMDRAAGARLMPQLREALMQADTRHGAVKVEGDMPAGDVGTRIMVKYIRTGDLPSGSRTANEEKIMQARLYDRAGTLFADENLWIGSNVLTIRNRPSCRMRALEVSMGIIPMSRFKGVGTQAGERNYELVVDCDAGVGQVNYQAVPTTAVINSDHGLAEVSGGAQGVAYQFLQSDGSPMQFYATDEFGHGSSSVEVLKKTFGVRYQQTLPTIMPGPANGGLVFSLTFP